jgi:drug/metabolite transporter (DMT)-like permease
VLVALVVLSAFLHAAWNALLKRETDKDRSLIAAIAVAALLAVVVAGLRWAIAGDLPFTGATPAGWALAAGVLELTYFVSLARALERGSLGPVYTISRGGAVVLVYPASIAAFGEAPTTQALAGSAIVLVGLVLSGLQPTAYSAQYTVDNRVADTPKATRGLGWALLCATSIAGYHLAYKAALGAGGSPSAVFAVALTLATAINLVRAGAAGRAAVVTLTRTAAPRLLAMGFLCGGSFLILMEALATGAAGFVLTLRNTSVLFATALAWRIGERPARPHVLGAVLVAIGAIAMAS